MSAYIFANEIDGHLEFRDARNRRMISVENFSDYIISDDVLKNLLKIIFSLPRDFVDNINGSVYTLCYDKNLDWIIEYLSSLDSPVEKRLFALLTVASWNESIYEEREKLIEIIDNALTHQRTPQGYESDYLFMIPTTKTFSRQEWQDDSVISEVYDCYNNIYPWMNITSADHYYSMVRKFAILHKDREEDIEHIMSIPDKELFEYCLSSLDAGSRNLGKILYVSSEPEDIVKKIAVQGETAIEYYYNTFEHWDKRGYDDYTVIIKRFVAENLHNDIDNIFLSKEKWKELSGIFAATEKVHKKFCHDDFMNKVLLAYIHTVVDDVDEMLFLYNSILELEHKDHYLLFASYQDACRQSPVGDQCWIGLARNSQRVLDLMFESVKTHVPLNLILELNR